jgi:hypothetical protein
VIEHFFSSLDTIEVVVAVAVACVVPKRWRALLLFATVLTAAFVATVGFLDESGGQPIFADDHPSFMYRLSQLKERFPSIPFYNPLWNAGVEAREFFPSGVLNVFLLGAPLLYLFPVESVYNLIVVGIFFFLVPGLGFLVAKMVKLGSVGVFATALLMISCSLGWYRWALTYGTVGFCVSAALSPLVILLAARSLQPDVSRASSERLLMAVTLTLCLLWSPIALLLLPLMPVLFLRLHKLVRVPSFRWMVVGLMAVNLPWITLFLDASNVFSFVSSTANTHGNSAKKIVEVSYSTLFKGVMTSLGAINPVLLVAGLAGLRAVCAMSGGVLYVVVCLWALVMGVFGPLVVPQLELERFLVVFALMLCLPAGKWIDVVLGCCTRQSEGRELASSLLSKVLNLLGYLSRVALLTGLVLVPVFLWRLIHFKTPIRYHFADRIVQDLSATIRGLEGDGRVLFSGYILHQLSGGHVAPLPYFTHRPLIASRYQHDRWHYTDQIPPEYRQRNDEGVREYLSLMNASHVVAHEQSWREWFSSRPDEYRLVEKAGDFWIFHRLLYSPTYFLKGRGEVLQQDGASVVVKLDDRSVVLKFNYYEHLESSDCTVMPYAVSKEVTFIELRDCKGSGPVVLSAMSPVSRLRSLLF